MSGLSLVLLRPATWLVFIKHSSIRFDCAYTMKELSKAAIKSDRHGNELTSPKTVTSRKKIYANNL